MAENHTESWLDELGPMSPAVRALVRDAVPNGDWFMHEHTAHRIVLRRHFGGEAWPAPFEEIVLNRTSGRFTGAHRYVCRPEATTRRVADVSDWITRPRPDASTGGDA